MSPEFLRPVGRGCTRQDTADPRGPPWTPWTAPSLGTNEGGSRKWGLVRKEKIQKVSLDGRIKNCAIQNV